MLYNSLSETQFPHSRPYSNLPMPHRATLKPSHIRCSRWHALHNSRKYLILKAYLILKHYLSIKIVDGAFCAVCKVQLNPRLVTKMQLSLSRLMSGRRPWSATNWSLYMPQEDQLSTVCDGKGLGFFLKTRIKEVMTRIPHITLQNQTLHNLLQRVFNVCLTWNFAIGSTGWTVSLQLLLSTTAWISNR